MDVRELGEKPQGAASSFLTAEKLALWKWLKEGAAACPCGTLSRDSFNRPVLGLQRWVAAAMCRFSCLWRRVMPGHGEQINNKGHVMTEEIKGNPESSENSGNGAAAPGFLARWIGKLPNQMFPKTSEHSTRTCALISLVVGGFALVFSFVPCLGMHAIWFAVPALYLAMVAIRRAPATDSSTHSKATIGTIIAILAVIASLWQCAVVNAAADAVDQAGRDIGFFSY